MTTQFDPLTLRRRHLHGLATPLDVASQISAHLQVSGEPAVVFDSLATACVPLFSDVCDVELIENEHPGRSISAPQLADVDTVPASAAAPAGQILTVFDATGPAGWKFRGVITHAWHDRRATLIDVAVARILIDRAVTGIVAERLAERTRAAEATAAQLQSAVQTGRQTAVAVGFLMATHRITEAAALERLGAESRRIHRELGDVAVRIVEAGQHEIAMGIGTAPGEDHHAPV